MSDLGIIGCVSVDTIRVPNRVEKEVFGGSGGYAAVAASFFTKVHLISNIGTDYPQVLLGQLEKLGINISGLNVLEGPSTHFDVEYDGELADEHYHVVDMNVGDGEIALPKDIDKCKFIYLSANDPEIQLDIMKKLNENQVIALDTHAMWIESKKDKVVEAFQNADIVFLNSNEAKMYSGKSIIKNAGKSIMEDGVDKLIIKKGSHGAVYFEPESMYQVPAFITLDMKVVDPTGCGDSTAGGFMGMLASNHGTKIELSDIYHKSLLFGMVMASFNLMDFSIKKMTEITMEDVWYRYDLFRDMLRI